MLKFHYASFRKENTPVQNEKVLGTGGMEMQVYQKLLPTLTGLEDPRLNCPWQCDFLTYRILVR